jgi:hypothetical protein
MYNNQMKQYAADSSELKSEIHKVSDLLLKKQIIIHNNKQFEVKNGGFMLFSTFPGSHFSGELTGNWEKNNDTLLFHIGGGRISYFWKFNILQLTTNRLKLKEISTGVENTNDVTNMDYEIEFYR